MGKSLNYIGKKSGKRDQLKAEKEVKLKKKEDYQKFYDSYPVEEIPEIWRCSACDEYYSLICEDMEVHESEWKKNAKESIRNDIKREYFKIGEVGKTKNKVGYKMARKCFEDDYFGDFMLNIK
eukprot:GFUD01004811.1.p2 GENE.GFUD01004811.1~~GFUD01004811.1.p2  ORF type:complete len:123 (-),score=43.29 GFUD01004811.1:469-837(-)